MLANTAVEAGPLQAYLGSPYTANSISTPISRVLIHTGFRHIFLPDSSSKHDRERLSNVSKTDMCEFLEPVRETVTALSRKRGKSLHLSLQRQVTHTVSTNGSLFHKWFITQPHRARF